MYIRIYIYMYKYICVCIYIYTYIYICPHTTVKAPLAVYLLHNRLERRLCGPFLAHATSVCV